MQTTAWQLLAANGALFAFVVGFYTLVGRERKSPYLINGSFRIFFVGIVGSLLDLASIIFSLDWMLTLGELLLLLAVIMTCWQVFKIIRRFVMFIDSAHPKHMWVSRALKGVKRLVSSKKEFEYNAMPLSTEIAAELEHNIGLALGVGNVKFRETLGQTSLAVGLKHHGQGNKLLAALCATFLKHGYAVQYMTVSRHPGEFIDYLHTSLPDFDIHLPKVANKVVAVDAYTPHFGFIDSVYSKMTRFCKNQHGVTLIKASVSFAGAHTASSNSFNLLKDRANSNFRDPILVIYENMYALTDLESVDQYRIFIRHVLPSERLWGGMFTVFTEVAQPDADWSILSSYASMQVDLRKCDE